MSARLTLQRIRSRWITKVLKQSQTEYLQQTPCLLGDFAVDLVDRYTVATIDRRLSSIGYYHKQARHMLPTKDPEALSS